MNNLQENVGGSSQYLANRNIIDMMPQMGKGTSRMDIQNLLTQILPRLNKLQSSDNGCDGKMSNPVELLSRLEPSVLSPLLDVVKCFQEENSGGTAPVGGGGNNGGTGGMWNNLDLSCDTNHWRDGPIDIKPTEEPLSSPPQANLSQPFKTHTDFESVRNSKLVPNRPSSSFNDQLSPAVITERVLRGQFQEPPFFQDEGGMLNGTRNHSTNTLPQMSPPMDLTSSRLNDLEAVSTHFHSQNNQSSKTYQELTSHPLYPRDLQLDVHNNEQNSNQTNSTIQELSPVKRMGNQHESSSQGNTPYGVFSLDTSLAQGEDEGLDGRDCFHSEHLSPKDIKIKTENEDLSEYVTSSGRNRGLGKANEPRFCCQVCGDIAAGFHCGAYVCEACKKFYLRCLKNGGSVAYTCPKTQECVISKETRSHCQYCRYKKCLALGMYKPGRDDSKHLRVDFKSIPCKVCAAPSSGFHFGAITCEGCKGFFRRMVKEKLHKKFMCTAGGNCDVASSNRTSCKACRYQKCVDIGMALEGTRLGRQSNSIKRSTLIQYMNSGLDVALFPKLGEGEPNDAHNKVDKLIRGSLPECVSVSTPDDEMAAHHEMSVFKIKEESDTDDNYGKCASEYVPLPVTSPIFQVNHGNKSPLNCSSQETVASGLCDIPDNKSYLHMDSHTIIEEPVAGVKNDSQLANPGVKMLSHNIPHQIPRTEYKWKDDEDEELSNTEFLPSDIKAREETEYSQESSLAHKRTYSSTDEGSDISQHPHHTSSVSASTGSPSSKYQKTIDGQVPGTSLSSNAKPCRFFSVSDAELSDNQPWDRTYHHPIRIIRSERQSSDSKDDGQSHRPQTRASEDGSWFHAHLKTRQKMIYDLTTMGYKLDYPFPKMHVYDPHSKRRYTINETACDYSASCGDTRSTAAAIQLGKSTNTEGMEENAVTQEDCDPEEIMISPKESKELLIHVIRAFRELENITKKQREPLRMEKPPCNEKSAAWWAAYESFMHHAKYTLRFVKKIPGFRELEMGDQITLVRESVYPITLLIHGRLYEPNVKKDGWFCNTEEEKKKIHHYFPKFKELENHLTYTGKLFRDMDLSLEEFAFLSAIMVFTIDSFLVKDTEAIQSIQGKLTDAFFDFCTEIQTELNRPGILLLRLAELKRANFEHTQIAIDTQRANPDVDFSQLWHEMFLSKVNY